MKFLSGIITLLLLWFCAPSGLLHGAEAGVLLTESTVLKIADAFMADHEYYRAITEYKKFLILFPDSENADAALLNIGMAYYHGEEYESAVQTFQNLIQKHPESRQASRALYFEGLGYWKLKEHSKARTALQCVAESYPDSTDAPLALVADTILSLERDDVAASRQDIQKLAAAYPDSAASRKSTETMALLDEYQNRPRKSEVLAGIMSAVLPGSGYIYAEHYGDGVTAFLINALAITGTITAAGNENYAVAAIVGGIGLPFYFGNIYGSANAAKKWNISVGNEIRNKVSVTLDYDF